MVTRFEGKTYRLVARSKPGKCHPCAGNANCDLCAETGLECTPYTGSRLVWRETFLSRLRRWWLASIASPLPDELDESNSSLRYAIQTEYMGSDRIAQKAREAAAFLPENIDENARERLR